MPELNAPLRGLRSVLHFNGKWGEAERGGRQAGTACCGSFCVVLLPLPWEACSLRARWGPRTDAEPLPPSASLPIPERGPPRGRSSALSSRSLGSSGLCHPSRAAYPLDHPNR